MNIGDKVIYTYYTNPGIFRKSKQVDVECTIIYINEALTTPYLIATDQTNNFIPEAYPVVSTYARSGVLTKDDSDYRLRVSCLPNYNYECIWVNDKHLQLANPYTISELTQKLSDEIS